MRLLYAVLLLTLAAANGRAQEPLLVGMGDSIGEAVQSAEASARNQRRSYIAIIARQMGAAMPLPLIDSWALGTIDQTGVRRRVDPWVEGLNLSVSGADVGDVLRRRADATTPEEIDSETDIVLFPRRASQMEIVEALRPEFVVCWIGNNDALSAAISFDELDASQMTSVASFARDFRELADRLSATGAKVVFGNIPDVTSIGFLMDRGDLERFVGSDFGLAPGSYTSLPVMLLLGLGLDDGGLLSNPDFVLDAAEVERIQERVAAFNAIIDAEAARIGAAVVDVHRWLGFFVENDIEVRGARIGPHHLGGLLSFDGVHPSHFGHAVLARIFLMKMNAHFGTSFPLPPLVELSRALLTDPFLDKDGDLRARGMPLNGALETVAPLLGFAGDVNDFRAGPSRLPNAELGRRFMRFLGERKGLAAAELESWDRGHAIRALRELFGIDALLSSGRSQ